MSLSQLLKKISEVKADYPLSNFNPLGCGGMAQYFTVANSAIELVEAVSAAIELAIPYLVMGEGDKLVFPDAGFRGLLIQNKSSRFAVSLDKTQVMVDSGLSLDKCITMAASQGLSGLSDFYGNGGTVGGNIYYGYGIAQPNGEQGFVSHLRGLTILVPKAKVSQKPTIVLRGANWLESGSYLDAGQQIRQTKLRAQRKNPGPQAVVVSAVLQLTRLRSDEILQKINEQSNRNYTGLDGPALGPLYYPLIGTNMPLSELLKQAGVTSLLIGNLFPDRYNPNYLRARGPVGSTEIQQLLGAIEKIILERYGVVLIRRMECL